MFESKKVGEVTKASKSCILALTNPRAKHVLPAPKSPSNKMASPAFEFMDNMDPVSSKSSTLVMDNLSVVALDDGGLFNVDKNIGFIV